MNKDYHWLIDWLSYWRTDGPTDRPTDRPTGWCVTWQVLLLVARWQACLRGKVQYKVELDWQFVVPTSVVTRTMSSDCWSVAVTFCQVWSTCRRRSWSVWQSVTRRVVGVWQWRHRVVAVASHSYSSHSLTHHHHHQQQQQQQQQQLGGRCRPS